MLANKFNAITSAPRLGKRHVTPLLWNGDFLMLPELLASFGHLDYDVVEMVLADQDSWDRYEAAKWLTMRRWLEANPDDEFATDFRAELTSEP